ncbi:MAG: hypothetical protein M3Y87_31035, partial [Myxococcota bacterium]|nr:hypothetical protein [Myxococcota bacterium]
MSSPPPPSGAPSGDPSPATAGGGRSASRPRAALWAWLLIAAGIAAIAGEQVSGPQEAAGGSQGAGED